MKSPFVIFRKHARVLTVVLTGLAMFAFIVMDQLVSNPEVARVAIPAILAGLLLGTAFWILGRPGGHANEYGVIGLLLGIVLMAYVVPRFNRPGDAVTLTIGSLSDKDVNDHVRRIQVANQFVYRAREAVLLGPAQPPFNFGDDGLDSAAMARILRHEADQMGIELSDKAVNDFIKELTENKLSDRQFRKIRTDMRLSETELFDILRELLRANLALQMLVPREYSTPAEFWDYYRRLNVRQEVKLAAIPVEPFIDEGTPSEDEIVAFFEKYKHKPPDRFLSPEPAFMQPRKIRIAYLEVDYEQVRRRLEKDPQHRVTDEEIEQFYEENKAIRYREQPAFGDESPSFEPPASPDKEQPLDPVIAPEPKTEAGDDEPEAKPPADEETPQKKPDGNASSDPADPADEADDGGQFSVQDDGATEAEGDADDGPVEAPLPGTPDDSQAADDSQPPVEAPVPPSYLPLDDELRADIRDELLHTRVMAEVGRLRNQAGAFASDIEDEFTGGFDRRREPTAEEKAERAKNIAARVQEYARREGLRYVELELLGPQELSERGEEAAQLWNELRGADAKPTAEDQQSLNYLIAEAAEVRLADEVGASGQLSVIQVLFGREDDRLYARDSAQDPLSNNQYVYWKLEDRPAEVPNLKDPGIREQVVAALKQKKARQPARERAAELAERVRKALENEKTMEEALAGQTVTGDKQSVELTVLDTGESFSWLSIPTAQSPIAFVKPPPVLSTIAAVEKAGSEFMQVAFDELDVGGVGVAPNADATAFYIIQVKSRTPATPAGNMVFRDRFMQETLFGNYIPQLQGATSTYFYLVNNDQSATHARWRQQLLEKYDYRPTR